MPNKLPLYTPNEKDRANIQRLMDKVKDITKKPHWCNLTESLEVYLEKLRAKENTIW